MSTFDTIYHELKCPDTGKVEEREIKIKWSDPLLNSYKVGDKVPTRGYLAQEDIWIKNEYECSNCSEQKPVIFHAAYIHLKKSKIVEVLSEEEFSKKRLKFIGGLEAAIIATGDGRL